MSETPRQPSPSRRTLVKGLAWLAPAVAGVASAPEAVAAASKVGPPRNAFACRYPGTKTPWTRTYRASICFSNGTSSSVDVSLRALRWRGFSPTFPPTGSLDGDYFYDPQICRPDGADDGSVADSCAAATSNYNFSIGPGDRF